MPRRAIPRGHLRMARYKDERHISRRTFLREMRWAPVLFVPAPMRALPFGAKGASPPRGIPSFSLYDFRLTPHYPAKSPLEDVLRLVAPGTDEFVTEKYAFEIARLLNDWGQALKAVPPALSALAKFLDGSAPLQSFSTLRLKGLRSRQVKKTACAPAAVSRSCFGASLGNL